MPFVVQKGNPSANNDSYPENEQSDERQRLEMN
jgi:hypothetical protein